MSWWVAELSPREAIRKIRKRVIPNLRYLPRSRVRVCEACQRMTLVVAFGEGEEFQLCIRCRANLRYELLARYLRLSFPDISGLDVLELDYGSPIRGILARARTYTRSFYRDNVAPGTVRGDGAVCQDITRLTYADASLDLIVSSDVLEHVPDVGAAFRESARVLRPGGVHVFTVPPQAATSRRAKIENGRVVHIASPEYHSDPLDPAGVLAFWDFGPDLAEKFPDTGLDIRVTLGPEGADRRIVWEARKTRG
jgi:SAM-dependent methyltransferase